MERLRNPRIPLPHRVFQPERKNSHGINLESLKALQTLSKSMQELLRQPPQLPAKEGEHTPVPSPANPEEVIGYYRKAGRQDCHHAFDRSRQAWSHWRFEEVEERASLLEATARLYEEHYAELMLIDLHAGSRQDPEQRPG